MNKPCSLLLRRCALAAAVLLYSTTFVWASCYGTPRAAIEAAQAIGETALKADKGGYKVVQARTDPLLGQRWVMVARCDHPEWPLLALPVTTNPSMEPAKLQSTIDLSPVVVHAGETVRLWRREPMLQIEVAGISEQNGRLGKTVRVRLLGGGSESSSSPQEFTGVVQGPADVEMQP